MQLLKWYIKYFSYILKHKYYVWLMCFRMWLFWQGIIHDYTKFYPCECRWYMRYYSLNDKSVQKEFNYARLHHQKHNPHHRQYRLLQEDNWLLKALDMPEKYIKEMLCDRWWVWRCFNDTGISLLKYNCLDEWREVKEWYEKNKNNIILSNSTRKYVHRFLFAGKK